MEPDPRWLKLRQGLLQLSDEQLKKILHETKPMVYDRVNYDERTGRF